MKIGPEFYKCSNCSNVYPQEHIQDITIKSIKQNVEEETREFWCTACIVNTKKGVALLKFMKENEVVISTSPNSSQHQLKGKK